MWYTKIAYKPLTHKLLKQQTIPYAQEAEEIEEPETSEETPQEIPGEVETPTPNIPQVIPPDLGVSIGNAPVTSPEPPPQSINPQAPSPENPLSPHDGCHCDKRLREIPTNKPYKRIFWDAEGACEVCKENAKAFNQRQEEFFNRLESTI